MNEFRTIVYSNFPWMYGIITALFSSFACFILNNEHLLFFKKIKTKYWKNVPSYVAPKVLH